MLNLPGISMHHSESSSKGFGTLRKVIRKNSKSSLLFVFVPESDSQQQKWDGLCGRLAHRCKRKVGEGELCSALLTGVFNDEARVVRMRN